VSDDSTGLSEFRPDKSSRRTSACATPQVHARDLLAQPLLCVVRMERTLGDEDLLAMLLGAREQRGRSVAAEMIQQHGGIGALSRATPREIAAITGITKTRAARVCAAFELGRRAVGARAKRDSLSRADDVYRILAPRMAGLQQEVFFVIGIDVRNRILDVVEVARGSVADVAVHPREVFRPLVRMAAAGAVLAHNHPTGDSTPSSDDLELTRRLREAGSLIGIPIIDHVVIGDGSHHSIAEWLGAEG
jgi:DNA repair protein RadC